ncbi:MAG: hypothetical protein WDM88_09990 [Galbitalea sp.]
MALVLAMVGVIESTKNILIAAAVLVTAVALGTAVGAAGDFRGIWLVLAAIPLVVVIVGAGSAVISYPSRSSLREQYRSGSEIRIVTSGGKVVFSLNSQLIAYPIEGVTRVWRFGTLSAVEFNDGKCVVIPGQFVPHRTNSGRESAPEWDRRA